MRFIAPERLYCLAVLLLPAAVLVYADWRRRREMRRLFSDRKAAEKATRLSRGGRVARIALVFVSLAAALVAAARPYWKTRRIAVSGAGRDVAVVFDVSKSMWAKDLPPSRLEHAKFVLRQLAQKLPGDRLSLIAFAGDAYLACPLTSDRAVFDEYVGELSAELVQRGGTDLERGLREALKSLRGAPGTQAIAVLTDGDELTGDSSRVVSELEKRKIPLVVIGLGDPKHPTELPDENGALRRDRDGRPVTSRLNEATLKSLAEKTGGAYIRSTVAAPGADAAAARIAELAPAQYGETEKEIPEERFDLFLALAAAALLLALIVPERPWRRAAAALLLFLVCDAGAAETPGPPVPEVPEARTAAELYNLGLKRHETGDPAGAERCFEAVLKRPDRDERTSSKALFNLGAMEHEKARRMLDEARRTVERQELDPALKKLEAAEKVFGAARELYGQALSGGGAPALGDAAADDLRLHEADLKRLEELKKNLEELKKQLEKARQSARNAQRQNQKHQKQDQQQQQNGQQKQDQQQQQNGQGKQDRQQQGGQQKQDRQQNGQQQRDAAQAAARQAARESENLQKQAEKLGQKQLEERARRAADDLRRAESAHDAQSAQPHLDRAVKELDGQNGGEPKKSAGEKPKDEQKNGERQDAEKPSPREEPQTAEKPEKPGENGPERLLRMLDDEERAIRRELRRRGARPPAGRDW